MIWMWTTLNVYGVERALKNLVWMKANTKNLNINCARGYYEVAKKSYK